MTRTLISIALIASATVAAVATIATSAAAQTKSTKPKPLVSTLVGVYTADQADRGKDVYAGNCKSCHSPASHTGATFTQWWRGKPLSELYDYIATKMPKNDPGSLSPDDAADVVAFLLKMNKMPVGKAELPADMDSLKHFRIETKRASATTTAARKKP